MATARPRRAVALARAGLDPRPARPQGPLPPDRARSGVGGPAAAFDDGRVQLRLRTPRPHAVRRRPLSALRFLRAPALAALLERADPGRRLARRKPRAPHEGLL